MRRVMRWSLGLAVCAGVLGGVGMYAWHVYRVCRASGYAWWFCMWLLTR